MGLFSSIKDKIFGHGSAEAAPAPQATAPEPTTPAASPVTPAQPAAESVDVGAVLSAMASAKGGGGNYQTSIVDLLKLLDLDSDLSSRKELAEELGVHAGDHGSAEQNIALHRAVMAKLAQSGGVVPPELRG